ncbi:MAG: hypothetical protein JWL71_1166 [Acidobacteria bacterium]|nr:hypothetical protein [Acidobacteriota bacterium]
MRAHLPGYRARALIVSLMALAVIAGCGRRPRTSRTGAPHQLKKSEMTPAELKYGIAPIPDATVTYQPDVIVVGGGGEKIRSQSTNGFIWTIDASAPHAEELAPGKVFFMTNRAVGRVLDVRKQGGDLVVVVGPVNLTDVVSEAHIAINTPIDFDEAIAYTSPDLPGRIDVIASALPRNEPAIRPAVYVVDAGDAGGQPPADPGRDVSNLVHFNVKPVANRFGIGLEVGSDAGGLKLYANSTLHIAAPTFEGKIDITPLGGLTNAYLRLTGGAGLTWKFAVGTDLGLRANVNGIIQPDTDFSLPIGGLGPLPVSVTVRQRLLVKTALGVKNTTLSATGVYSFNGAFTIGFVNGDWTVGGPVDFSTDQNMMKTAEGISLGAAGLDLTDEIKVIAGIGVHGFAAGPYFRVTSAMGVFKGSSAGMIACKEATIDVKLSAGVGYIIPKVVTKLFNAILSALNIKYRIDGEGSLSAGSPQTLFTDTSTLKGCNAGKE